MRKVVYLLLAGLVVTSCSKENHSTTTNDQSDPQMVTLHSVNTNGIQGSSFSFPVDNLVSSTTVTSTTKSDLPSVQKSGPIMNGHFSTGNGTSVSFSGVSNNGGIHGNANFVGTLDFKFSTACMEVDSNRGVIAGSITQITSFPNGLDTLLFVGDYVYFHFIDNGEGANSLPDQYNGQFYYSPASLGPLCDQIPPQSPAWNSSFNTNVSGQGDQIQVR